MPSPESLISGVTVRVMLLAVAQEAEHGGLALLVLQVGEQGWDGADGEAVDADDLVAGFEAGAVGGPPAVGRLDLDGRVLHLRDEAHGQRRVERELVGAAFECEEERGVGALAVVDVGEGDGLVGVQRGVVEDVFPGGILDVVEVDDGVAGVDAGLGDGGCGRDVVGDGGAGDVLVDLVVEHVGAGHEAEGEDEVGDGAGERR